MTMTGMTMAMKMNKIITIIVIKTSAKITFYMRKKFRKSITMNHNLKKPTMVKVTPMKMPAKMITELPMSTLEVMKLMMITTNKMV